MYYYVYCYGLGVGEGGGGGGGIEGNGPTCMATDIVSHPQPPKKVGIYTILMIGEWPVSFPVKRKLAIFKNVNSE